MGFSSIRAISSSNAPSASPSLWNAHARSPEQRARNVAMDCSNPFDCCREPSSESASGSVAPSNTAALTVSGNMVAHTEPSSLP